MHKRVRLSHGLSHTVHAAGASTCDMEQLEQRTVLSTSFAFAGLEYRDTSPLPVIVLGEGTRADDGGLTGTTTKSHLATGSQTIAMDISSMTFNVDGSMDLRFSGLPTVLEGSGADFRSSAGFPAGYFSGRAPSVTNSEFTGHFSRYFVERTAGVRRWEDAYNDQTPGLEFLAFSAVVVRPTGVEMLNGVIDLVYPEGHSVQKPMDPVSAVITMGPLEIERTIQSVDDDGTIRFTTGDVLFFGSTSDLQARAGSVGAGGVGTSFVYADPNADDGIMVMGTGGRRQWEETVDNRASGGLYRGSVQVDTDLARGFFGLPTDNDAFNTNADVVFNLALDGSWKAYKAAEFNTDPPAAEEFASGYWRNIQSFYSFERDSGSFYGTVQLVNAATGEAALFYQDATGGLSAAWVVGADGTTHDEIAGTLDPRTESWRFSGGAIQQVTLDELGHPHAFMMRQDSLDDYARRWSEIDLITAAGGLPLVRVFTPGNPDISARPTLSPRLSPGGFVVGVDVNGHAVAYELLSNGRWIFKDLTTDLLGGRTLDSAIAMSDMYSNRYGYFGSGDTFDRSTQFFAPLMTGVANDGHRVLVYPWGNYGRNIEQTYWSMIDVSDALVASGRSEPVVDADSVATLGTSWGQVAVVGLDSGGHVQSMWTASNAGWFVDDLSVAAGAEPLVGRLTTELGYINSLNIFGFNAQNEVVRLTAPWEEGFRWRSLNLTETTGGPIITAPIVAMYQFDRATLSVGGVDQSGQVSMYWAGRNELEWNVADLTAAVPTDLRPVSVFASQWKYEYRTVPSGAYSSTLGVFGLAADGDLIRISWPSPTGADQWTAENVTDQAFVLA